MEQETTIGHLYHVAAVSNQLAPKKSMTGSLALVVRLMMARTKTQTDRAPPVSPLLEHSYLDLHDGVCQTI